MIESIQLGPYKLFYEDPETFKHTLVHGEHYESHVWTELKNSLKTARSFLDIGCNVGFYTVMAKWFMGPAFPTISIDVNPLNCSLLLRTIALNGFWNSLVLPVAASDADGTVNGNNSWNTGLIKTPATNHFCFKYWAMPLDSIWLGAVDVIKIDVEGFELFALKGMGNLIAGFKPTIVFEYNTHCMEIVGVEPLDLLGFFLGIGYNLTVLDYKPGMRSTFRDAVACRDHIAKFGQICDIVARPIH